ncbi:hypothetical protein SGPA1_60041 [Streptomyces misionensis JCM 4497]
MAPRPGRRRPGAVPGAPAQVRRLVAPQGQAGTRRGRARGRAAGGRGGDRVHGRAGRGTAHAALPGGRPPQAGALLGGAGRDGRLRPQPRGRPRPVAGPRRRPRPPHPRPRPRPGGRAARRARRAALDRPVLVGRGRARVRRRVRTGLAAGPAGRSAPAAAAPGHAEAALLGRRRQMVLPVLLRHAVHGTEAPGRGRDGSPLPVVNRNDRGP